MHFKITSCLLKLLEEITISVIIFALISCAFIWFYTINFLKFFMENSIGIIYLVGGN